MNWIAGFTDPNLILPALYKHDELQNEWCRIVSRGGRAEPALTVIEEAITTCRQLLRDGDFHPNAMPRLIPDLEFLGEPGEPTYCHTPDGSPGLVGNHHHDDA